MTWPAYPAYVDSDADWLGSLPAHWQAPQIGMHARVGNGSTPLRDNAIYWSQGTVPWLNSSNVQHEQIVQADQFVTEQARRECHLPLVSTDSVLVALTGEGRTRGKAALLRFPATINQHLAYITPTTSALLGEYLYFVLSSAYSLLRRISDETGSTKGALTCLALRKFRTPLPPLDEQRDIAGFLHSQTASIDTLITKQEQLIATLREDRNAIITNAVNKGLDPDVEMKASGLPWADASARRTALGDVMNRSPS
jgi:type I restriction enzyme, S subunit